MTGDEWRRVKTVVADALDLPEAERAAFVDARCAADGGLRDSAQSLLASAVTASGLYETPVMTAASLHAVVAEAEAAGGTFVGRRIGAYRLVSELGRGGMGTAYLAERDDSSFTRRVAIKLIKRGMDTDAILQRFLNERQILASLNHPNIATLLDGGTTDDDLPYFVMEYVEGQRVDAFCNARQLTIDERLALFLDICGAVEHAHQNRVVHRDLKPANILVTTTGVVKLLDFGIAKLLDAESGLHTDQATSVVRAMTLEYASPEQVRSETVTAATDVYALGVLLYELLTGHNPQSTAGRSPLQTERAICEDPPRRPSRIVEDEPSTLPGLTTRALRRQLSGDLDAIVMTALQKAPAKRYATVKALADDVRRHLSGQPILTGIDRIGPRITRRLLRRDPLVAAAIVLAGLGAAVVWYSLAGRTTAAQAGSIAVLPLSIDGGEGDNLEVLSQGLTENVIRRLSRLSGLKVIARDSAYRYVGPDVDAVRAGRQLGVQAVLKGRLTESQGRFVLYAELVDVGDASVLWSERYERPVGDVQFLQAELAQQIANRLRGRVSSAERARVAANDSTSPDAYQQYLRGRYFSNRRTTQDLRKAVLAFTQAVERDPSFALAYSGLADAYGLLTEYHEIPARDTYGPAKEAATRALAVDEGLAEAHASLAYIKEFYEWDFAGAEAEFKRAIEIDPAYATAHQWYAEMLAAIGRFDEALVEIRRAASADSLSLIVNSVEANILYQARRYDEAIDVIRRVLDMDPNFPEVYEYLKRAYDQKGLYAESVQARQTRRRLLGRDPALTPALRRAAAATSSREYWKARLEQELIEGRDEGLQAFEMAEIVGQAGDVKAALDWLERACEVSDFMIVSIRVAPNLDPLRQEPRFKEVMGRSCRVR